MKKLFITLFCVIFLISCGGKTTQETGEEPEKEMSAKEKMGYVIAYTNAIIDFNINVNRTLESCRFTEIESDFSNKEDERLSFFAPTNFAYNTEKEKETLKSNLLNVPEVISADDQKMLKENALLLFNSFEEGYSHSMKLKEYAQREKYKDDNYAGGQAIFDSIKQSFGTYYETRKKINDKIQELTANADEMMLEGDPLKEPLLAMKKVLDNTIKLENELYALYEKDPEVNLESVGQSLDALEKFIDEQKEKYPTDETLKKKKIYYDLFFETANRVLPKYIDFYRKLKNNEKIHPSEVKILETRYKGLVDRYNSSIEAM